MEMSEHESGPAFAARYWGGEGITAEQSDATYGPRDVDGGRYVMPAGWAFWADGFAYRVWVTEDTRHGSITGEVWHMQASDGAFATYWLTQDGVAPPQWAVDRIDGRYVVPALGVAS